MKHFYRVCFSITALLVAFGLMRDVAMAQVPNNVAVVASGQGGSINITVDLDVGGTLPPEWVGWVVDRTTIGVCDQPVVQIGATTPFPVGEQSYSLGDITAAPGVTYRYWLFAVDADGTRHYLPGYTEWPPGYYHFDYASINDDGLVAEGTLTDLGWTVGIELCPDACWGYLSFISEPPEEFLDLVGTPATVQIFGEIDAEFEGSYISAITGWSIISGCSEVPIDQIKWGGVKALYR